MTIDLYTASEQAKVRQKLYTEQDGLCALARIPVPLKDCHLDHKHDDDQLVRGTLYKQSNMVLGKLEGLWLRYLSYWYPHDLPTFLRASADYLERTTRTPDLRWRHSGWMKRLVVMYNKLTTKQRDSVLKQLGSKESCTNDTQRKKVFALLLKNRELGYNVILDAIKKSKLKG